MIKEPFIDIKNMDGDKVDISTAISKLMITVLSRISEFEADMIMERQLDDIHWQSGEEFTKVVRNLYRQT